MFNNILISDDHIKWRLASFKELHQDLVERIEARAKLIAEVKRVAVKHEQSTTSASELFESAAVKMNRFNKVNFDICANTDEHHQLLQVL